MPTPPLPLPGDPVQALRLLDGSVALDPARAAALLRTATDAAEFLEQAESEATRAAYKSDWGQFAAWVEAHGLPALPADPRMVALWISHMARSLGRKPSSIRRMLTTIGTIHRRAGHPNPCDSELIRTELRGIQHVLGVRPRRAAPILIPHLEALVASMGDDLRGVRDRAIVLAGWSGALRRSEIAAVTVEDLAFMDKGCRVLLRRSKTDQAGEGQYVGLFFATRTALCPVRAIQAWRERAGIETGPLFRRLTLHREPRLLAEALAPSMVNAIVKRWTRRAAVQPEQLGDAFSAHSLRAGFITEAARNDRAEWQIAKQSRHRSAECLRTYIRVADTFQGNAGEGLL